jgi:hypothetical protein
MYDFGPLAANKDPQILNYFHTTNQVSELISNPDVNRSFILVARPGSGKTALVTWLVGGSTSNTVIAITPDAARFLLEDDSTTTHEDQSLYISSELYRIIFSKVIEKKETSENLRSECKKYLESISTLLSKFFQDRVVGFNAGVFGITLAPKEKQPYLNIIRKDQNMLKAKELIKRIQDEQKLFLVVDNPESIVGKGLNNITQENGIRIGSFFSSLAELKDLGVQVFVFVKEHIMQLVLNSFPDSSHFKDQIISLEWTEEELLALINQRVIKRIKSTWNDVFEISQVDFTKLVLPFLINGPRDLIYICNTAGKGKGKITRNDLKQGIRKLQNDKWREISQEFNQQWPLIDQFSRIIIDIAKREINTKQFAKEEFIEVVSHDFEKPDTPLNELRKKKEWINSVLMDPPPFDERMFIIGALGYIIGGEKHYPWSGQSIDKYRLAKKIFISPLLSDLL